MNLGDTALHEYAFDIKLLGSVRVNANSEAEAREMLRDNLDAATVNAGAWPNGDPIVFEASIDGEGSLYEIDGEETP
jgi:hypothetical protein